MITTIKTNNAQLLNYEELDIATDINLTRHFNPDNAYDKAQREILNEVAEW
jgi:hypothetical protein